MNIAIDFENWFFHNNGCTILVVRYWFCNKRWSSLRKKVETSLLFFFLLNENFWIRNSNKNLKSLAINYQTCASTILRKNFSDDTCTFQVKFNILRIKVVNYYENLPDWTSDLEGDIEVKISWLFKGKLVPSLQIEKNQFSLIKVVKKKEASTKSIHYHKVFCVLRQISEFKLSISKYSFHRDF